MKVRGGQVILHKNKNNLFGHHAYDKDPNGSANGYSSVDYSIYYHSAIFFIQRVFRSYYRLSLLWCFLRR